MAQKGRMDRGITVYKWKDRLYILNFNHWIF
jgi:hypothetical protein